MAPHLRISDPSRESVVFSVRAACASLIVAVLTIALVARLVHLQVLEHKHFTTLSEDNRVKVVPIAPTRGLIFDRNGEILAQNLPTFSLEVVPEAVDDIDALIDDLRAIIDISDESEQAFRTALANKRRFENVPLRLRLDGREVASFAVNRHRFPGVDVHARLTRNYPQGELGAHVVGYVGRINKEELARLDRVNYRGTLHVGKTGVEASYEGWLHGRVGFQHVETNAQGRILRVLERHDPVPGKNLFLTVDAELQRVAEAALAEERGAIIAMEPATGSVLAMASTPGFDPNLFAEGIDAKTYRALRGSPDRPLFNRALNGQYPPGSTIKPFLGLAGLEQGVGYTRGETWCPGYFTLPGRKRRFRDWKKWGHGRVRLHDAIEQSCDVFFYELSLALGIDRMHEYMTRFGFGERTGIRLNGESRGLMPSREWKRAARDQAWYPGETVITGIGQGFVLTTPLQLASATAGLAMRGIVRRPRLVDRAVEPATGEVKTVEPETMFEVKLTEGANWQRVIDAMVGVVHGEKGTARRIGKDLDYQIAGKTGTAQVFSVGQNEKYDADKLDKRLHDHGLFIAFAPVEQPRVAVATIVENGGSGSGAAAPLARTVIQAYLEEVPAPKPPAEPSLTASAGDRVGTDSSPASDATSRVRRQRPGAIERGRAGVPDRVSSTWWSGTPGTPRTPGTRTLESGHLADNPATGAATLAAAVAG